MWRVYSLLWDTVGAIYVITINIGLQNVVKIPFLIEWVKWIILLWTNVMDWLTKHQRATLLAENNKASGDFPLNKMHFPACPASQGQV